MIGKLHPSFRRSLTRADLRRKIKLLFKTNKTKKHNYQKQQPEWVEEMIGIGQR
jgi:hypothetical protein